MRAIIAGGGVGGLTLALALDARGVKPLVLEQADRLRDVSLGVEATPQAMLAFKHLGVGHALSKVALPIDERIYKTTRGQEILREPLGSQVGYDQPHVSVDRRALRKALSDALATRVGCEAFRTGVKLIDCAQTDRAVAATFVRGAYGPAETISGDLLIGADGSGSRIRQFLHREEPSPRPNGSIVWRGAAWMRSPFGERAIIVAGGADAKMAIHPIQTDPDRPGETLLGWTLCAHSEALGLAPGAADLASEPIDPIEAARRVGETFALEQLDVVALVRASPSIMAHAGAEREPLARVGRGRVTLLGDAAHPSPPLASDGVSRAILDAARLADLIVDHADPAAALEAYDLERRAATREIIEDARLGGAARVIDFVAKRAPLGFKAIDEVATVEELRAIVGSRHGRSEASAAASG